MLPVRCALSLRARHAVLQRFHPRISWMHFCLLLSPLVNVLRSRVGRRRDLAPALMLARLKHLCVFLSSYGTRTYAITRTKLSKFIPILGPLLKNLCVGLSSYHCHRTRTYSISRRKIIMLRPRLKHPCVFLSNYYHHVVLKLTLSLPDKETSLQH